MKNEGNSPNRLRFHLLSIPIANINFFHPNGCNREGVMTAQITMPRLVFLAGFNQRLLRNLIWYLRSRGVRDFTATSVEEQRLNANSQSPLSIEGAQTHKHVAELFTKLVKSLNSEFVGRRLLELFNSYPHRTIKWIVKLAGNQTKWSSSCLLQNFLVYLILTTQPNCSHLHFKRRRRINLLRNVGWGDKQADTLEIEFAIKLPLNKIDDLCWPHTKLDPWGTHRKSTSVWLSTNNRKNSSKVNNE